MVRWIPALAWMAVIFAGSSVRGSNMPGVFSVEGHFAEYAVLGVLVLFASRRLPITPRALVALTLCSLYAVSDEFHQSFVPGRVPDVADWAVDTLGAGLGIAALIAAQAYRGARVGSSSSRSPTPPPAGS